MKKKLLLKNVLVFMICVLPALLNAQEKVIVLNEGLVLTTAHLGRNSLSEQDPIEEMFVKNIWITPKAGKTVKYGTENLTWENVSADSSGWFKEGLYRNGYIYIEYFSDENKAMTLEASSHRMVYVNGEPRQGNVYKYADERNPWEPNYDISYLPIEIKKGKNTFVFQSAWGRLKARLHEVTSEFTLNINDLTSPDVFVGEEFEKFAAIIVNNNTDEKIENLFLISEGEGLTPVKTGVPVIQAMSVRKVKFDFSGKAADSKGEIDVTLKLVDEDNKVYDSKIVKIRIQDKLDTYKNTFISDIDNSVQYYAVNPSFDTSDKPQAMFFSLHGAAVEAVNQAGSYYNKSWGNIVSPTNRRPFGYNWEDWGRLDALEVFDIAEKKFNIDPSRVYLTGHSMGGHGTWHIGVTFPDRFAAIGPSAGWISFWSYRYYNKFNESSPLQSMMFRPTLGSDTYALSPNYEQLGVYIIHGSADDNVKAEQSHQMVENLEKFHKDFVYHEEPDAGHWWDNNDERGADCVDWLPLFDYFSRHARPTKERIRNIKFKTASPGISHVNNWIRIYSQNEFFKMSSVDIRFDPGMKRFVGTTENVKVMCIETIHLNKDEKYTIDFDGTKIEEVTVKVDKLQWLSRENDVWKLSTKPSMQEKGPHRYGGFKEAFNNNMVFVYGTNGNDEEDRWGFYKARFDAEKFWYQGNGSIEVVADEDFDKEIYKNSNVILYGNSETNSVWDDLLKHAPVSITSNKITIGNKTLTGTDKSCFFLYPKENTEDLLIGVVGATGIEGMRLANMRPYMKPGYAYPDFVIFNSRLLNTLDDGIDAAGFFGHDWSVENGDFVWKKK